jgi:ATP-dependent Lon protease
MFIATANSLSTIQPALLDRMEVIEISGYSQEEKVQIAKKHLVPKQIENHGLKKNQIKIGNKSIEKIIQHYTRESGVRNLDRVLAKVLRSVAKKVAMEEKYDPEIKPADLDNILGKKRYDRDLHLSKSPAGVATGLAWTSVGGDILFIECGLNKGKGNLNLTGNLGKVMKESAITALSYIRSHHEELGIDPKDLERHNFHIHVPEGAVPKDGPSAGITMLSAMVSRLTGRRVKNRLAMTGEITLRGKVLPVGGIKEKVLAAKRAGIKEIVLCEQNKKDIEEINPRFIRGLKFHFVSEMHEVLDTVLLKR